MALSEHTEKRQAIKDRIEERLDALADEMQDLFEAECIETVRRWEERWPRHKFSVAISHGLILASVEPAIMGKNILCEHDLQNKGRGALVELGEELEALSDWEVDLEWRFQPGDTHWLTSSKSSV